MDKNIFQIFAGTALQFLEAAHSHQSSRIDYSHPVGLFLCLFKDVCAEEYGPPALTAIGSAASSISSMAAVPKVRGWVEDGVYIFFFLRDGNIFIRIGYVLCSVRSYENYYVH